METRVLGCSVLVEFLGLCYEKFSFRTHFRNYDDLFQLFSFSVKRKKNTRSFECGRGFFGTFEAVCTWISLELPILQRECLNGVIIFCLYL